MSGIERNNFGHHGEAGTHIGPRDGREPPSICCGMDDPPGSRTVSCSQAGLTSSSNAQSSSAMIQRQGMGNGPGEALRGQHKSL